MGRWQTDSHQSLHAVFGPMGRRLSWKETAEAFRTSWDKIFDAVEHMVTWGLRRDPNKPTN